MSAVLPLARQRDLVVQDMPDEVLVYDISSNRAHCLNETSAFVWRSCDGKTSIADIAAMLERSAGAKVSEDLVWLAIDQLNEKSLLDSGHAMRFEGRSRREALKKIGMASIVLLPVVASLVAPPNAMASTSCACTTSSQCPSKTGCPSLINCNLGVGGQCQP